MNSIRSVSVVLGDQGPQLIATAGGIQLQVDLEPRDLQGLAAGAIALGAISWPSTTFGDLAIDLAAVQAGVLAAERDKLL